LAGINKFANPAETVAMMTGAGFPMPGLLVYGVALFELTGGLLLLSGRRGAAWAALALALFTFATNIFHPFWALSGDAGALQLSLFFKNVAIGGALLMTFSLLHRRGL
jgi:uncharacterized membrane protein YphA (DoxX/SURF4 family)